MSYPEKIFISHAHEDRIIAGALKTSLENIGYQAFVAHDDIIPATTFNVEIAKALDECKVFIVILSQYSNKSQWVSQEIGYAYAKNAFIIPIKTDSEDPKAFIALIQALPFHISGNQHFHDNMDIYDSCASLVRSLINAQKKGIPPSSIDKLINELISSSNYNQSSAYFKNLDKVSVFSEEQVDKLLDAALMNDQVSGTFAAKPFYDRLLTKNRHYGDKEKIEKVRNLFSELP